MTSEGERGPGASLPTQGGAPPLVSVVIIFLNGGALLTDAIDSVRAQTVTDWELILVDDGSTDASTETARAASGADPARIRALEHPGHVNLGTSASRELGLQAARGTFLLYLDADDILFTDALATLLAALEAAPGADAALAETLFWNWHPAFARRKDTRQDLRPWAGRHAAPALLTAMTRDEYMHPANCSSLFRRQVLLDLGGFEAEFTGMYEDTVLLAKVLLERPVVMIDACVSAYRMHPSSQCHRAAASGTYDSRRPNTDRARYLRWLRRHVRERGVRDAALRLMIAREVLRFEWRAAEHAARKGRGAARRAWRLARALSPSRGRPGRAAADEADEAGREAARRDAVGSLAASLVVLGAPAEADTLRRRLEAREPA